MSATGRGREREADDYYSTPSWCVRRLLEEWTPPELGTVVEPSAGNGAIIRAAAAAIPRARWVAVEVRAEERPTLAALASSVLIGDFLRDETLPGPEPGVTAVIGNPPYSLAWQFVREARHRFPKAQVCYLLRIAFAASEERNQAMRIVCPDVYVLPNRPSFTGDGSDSADYGWFLWPPVAQRSGGRFQVLKTTPLEERKRDRGHEVMIEPAQRALFG